MTRILVIGAAGRMGRTIASCIHDTEGAEVAGGTELPGNPYIGNDVGELAGIGKIDIAVSGDLEEAIGSCDVVIDFSTPESSMDTLRSAAKILT